MADVWFVPDILANVSGTMEATMERIVQFLQSEVVRSISEGQPPSRPGKPPHVDTGELKGTIKKDVVVDKAKVIGRVGSDFPGAPRLELGFVGKDAKGRNVQQLPRPFLRPAIYKHKAEIREILRNPSLRLKVKAGRRTKGRVRNVRGRI